jgi:hypothetical protein
VCGHTVLSHLNVHLYFKEHVLLCKYQPCSNDEYILDDILLGITVLKLDIGFTPMPNLDFN